MLFDTKTTLTAEASLDSLWMKTQVIANNLANVDTPGFKASNVTLEQSLRNAEVEVPNKEGHAVSGGGRRDGGSGWQARVTTDDATSVRVDGNNVQLEKEQAELWKTYAQYSYLLDRVGGHYANINSVIQNMKG